MNILETITNKKVALYGLGTETERIISEWNDQYEIVGLLDGFKEEGEQFGYPILSLVDVAQMENIVIVVVARPGSCKAIAKRIGDVCRAKNIEVYDIRGNNLLQTKKVVYDFKALNGYKKSDLLALMQKAEAISFDLFDTLIMRSVSSLLDVIEIVEAKLVEQKILIPDFCNRRISAEKQLSYKYAPTLVEIYEQLLKESKIVSISAKELAELEYETDFSVLVARKDVVNLVKECNTLGKKVFITTDCYYCKEKIERIIEGFCQADVEDILVSCEYGTGKTDDLFDRLIEIAGTTGILHIGDDVASDNEAAQRHNIKSFKIYSGEELFDAAGGLGFVDHITSLSDRIRVGMFIAKVFNSPFQFEDKERRICIHSAEEIGFLFCAPIIMDFTYWFGEQVQENELRNIWFCARDGYLLKFLFEQIYPSMESKYFLTSRISAIRAGVMSEADIRYVDSMKYSGEVEESLWTRFGIDASKLCIEDIETGKEGLEKYTNIILANATDKRRNNLKYIERLSIQEGNIALFDFVAKGTSQMYLQKIVSREIMGLYFLQLEPEFMREKGLYIKPFYTEDERMDSAIFDNYYILETILTSPEPSVEEFDSEGNAIYAMETRNNRDIACFMRVQKGIKDYVEKYIQLCPKSERKINKKLDEKFLTLIHNVELLDDDFIKLKIEDPFFNRMTDILDVL